METRTVGGEVREVDEKDDRYKLETMILKGIHFSQRGTEFRVGKNRCGEYIVDRIYVLARNVP